MRILVSGSHGLVGSALTRSLEAQGEVDVIRLVRHSVTPGAKEIEWNPVSYSIGVGQMEDVDAVIHLAGENIAESRWSREKKRRIRESRVNGTKLLCDALVSLKEPPRAFLCASAIGYYGDRGDELLTEESSPGEDFLAGVCVDWEKSTNGAAEKGIRVVNLRFGIILSAEGGALKQMMPPFRLGIGGRIGSGKQWMSWITLDDIVGAIEHILYHGDIGGPINVVSPNPIRNAEFTKSLGQAISRPTIFPIPEFGVRLAFGEMADSLLLSSQRVSSQRLTESGYPFRARNIQEALSRLLS